MTTLSRGGILKFIIFLLIYLQSVSNILLAKDGIIKTYHNGIEVCECYFHCSCFNKCLIESSPSEKPSHPIRPIDQAWHEFMKGILTAKQVGPFMPMTTSEIEGFVRYYSSDRNVHFISEYLESIEKFRKMIAKAMQKGIDRQHEWYPSSKDQEKLHANIRRD